MNTSAFYIDHRLLNDSHELFIWNQCNIRLHKNATIPWMLIIPQTQHIELYDLPTAQLNGVNRLAQLLGKYIKHTFSSKKLNIAAIGNVVEQLHIHVIGRHPNDSLWPDVVWGNSYPETSYNQQQVSKHAADLLTLLEQTF